MNSNEYTERLCAAVNKAWKTVKPYVQKLDNGLFFSDDVIENMKKEAREFVVNNPVFLDEIPESQPGCTNQYLTEMVLNLMMWIASYAARLGQTDLIQDQQTIDDHRIA